MNIKKLLAGLLSLSMVVSVLPVGVYAEETSAEDTSTYIFYEDFEGVEIQEDGTPAAGTETGFEAPEASSEKLGSTYISETIGEDETNQYIQYQRSDTTLTNVKWYYKDLSSLVKEINREGGIYEISVRVKYNQMKQFGDLFKLQIWSTSGGWNNIFNVSNSSGGSLNISGLQSISGNSIMADTWMDITAQFSIDSLRYLQGKTTVVYTNTSGDEITATGKYGVGANLFKGGLTKMEILATIGQSSYANSTRAWGLDDIKFKEVANTDFVVNFDTQADGITVEDAPISEAGIAFLPADPERDEAHLFKGWYTDPECTTEFDHMNVDTTKDVTVYAKWVGAPVVTFKANAEDETAFATAYASESGVAVLPETNPEKTGYCFDKWVITDENGITTEFKGTGVTEDVTVTAAWLKCTYIHFNTNGGNEIEDTHAHVGVAVDADTLPIAEKKGYKFLGWYISNEENADKFTGAAEQIVDGDITLYAKWAQSFTVSFDTAGGEGTFKDQPFLSGETIIVPTVEPVKQGYIFAGWYNDDGEEISEGPFTEDMVFTAKWVERNTDGLLFYEDFEELEYNSETGAVVTTTGFQTAASSTAWRHEYTSETKTDAARNEVDNNYVHYSTTTSATNQSLFWTQAPNKGYGGSEHEWNRDSGYYEVNYDIKYDGGLPDASALIGVKMEVGGRALHLFQGESRATQIGPKNARVSIDDIMDGTWINVKGQVGINSANGADGKMTITYTDRSGVERSETRYYKNTVDYGFWTSDLDRVVVYSQAFYTFNPAPKNPVGLDNIELREVDNTEYSVTFSDSLDDSHHGTAPINKTGICLPPATPKKTGWVFAGWYTDKACTTAFDHKAVSTTSDITVYAKWVDEKYVTFMIDKNTVYTTVAANLAGDVKIPATNPKKSGYNFVRWEYEDGTEFVGTGITEEDVVVYAKWVPAMSIDSAVYSPENNTLAVSATVHANLVDLFGIGVFAIYDGNTFVDLYVIRSVDETESYTFENLKAPTTGYTAKFMYWKSVSSMKPYVPSVSATATVETQDE